MKWIKDNLEYLVLGTIIAVILGGLAFAVYLGVESSSHPAAAEMNYRPAAYGENGQCYYVNSPAEVTALQQAGMCPTYWVPTVMPIYWHCMYASYYHSPYYYNSYIPSYYRNTYVTEVHTFETVHRTEIVQRQSAASYKGSDGKTVNGTTVANQVKSGQGSFSGSSSSGQTTTTKSNPAPAAPPPAPVSKPAAPAPAAAKSR